GKMVEGIDLDRRPAWSQACDATYAWLAGSTLHQRRYYVAVALPNARRPWLEVLRDAVGHVDRSFGLSPRPVPADEVDMRRRQARESEVRLAQHISLAPVTAGELCWLYARALR